MKKKILAVALSTMFVFGMSYYGTSQVSSNTSKGTLYGNASGTKFCCASGTNECSSAKCKPSGAQQ